MVSEWPTLHNEQEKQAQEVIALVDGVIGRKYAFDPAPFVKILEQVKEYKDILDENPLVRKEFAKRLYVLIDKIWRSEAVVKADTNERKAAILVRLKEMQNTHPDGDYLNNFRGAFVEANNEFNSRMDVIAPEDFKNLQLNEKELARLYWFGIVRSLQTENRPDFIRNTLDAPELQAQGNAVDAQLTADMNNINPLLKTIFDRLVVEYGYEPEKLAG